jgi:YkoY family integral membrane protein
MEDFINTLVLNWNQILENPSNALSVVWSLVLMESLLSVDNAAVLATMVMDLPKEQRSKALKYGIIGAYVFRGLCLVLAYWLAQVWWLKGLGGLYLVYLAFSYFKGKSTPQKEDDVTEINKSENWLYKATIGKIGVFWSTVIAVEAMDLAFSIDNVFAAVALSKNMILIYLGVFIGILAMRFVAQAFIKLLEKFPFLETIAFIVIALLGIKLALSLYTHNYPHTYFSIFLEGNPEKGIHSPVETYLSIGTTLLFLIPVATSYLFNFPARKLKS